MKTLKYGNRIIELKPYTTKEERDLLLYTSDVSKGADFDKVIEILRECINSNIPIEQLSRKEIFYIILQLRNISVGESFNFTCTCNKCSRAYDFDAFFIEPLNGFKKIPTYNGIVINEAFSDDYNKYVDFDMDEMDLDEYDKLVEHIDKHKNKFNFSTESFCPYCGAKGIINLSEKDLVSNLSEDTIANFYEVISGLVYFGNYSLADVNQMLPFERSIYLGLLNKQKSKQSEL